MIDFSKLKIFRNGKEKEKSRDRKEDNIAIVY